MTRRKRNSALLERAERRFESIRSINPQLDLGGGLTLAAYATVLESLRSKLATYNTALSTLDRLADDVSVAEKIAVEMSEKMLLGIGSRYGKTSQEYEMAGGSRRRNKRRFSTPSTTIPSVSSTSSTVTNGTVTNGTASSAGAS